jgi:hypothetical protein
MPARRLANLPLTIAALAFAAALAGCAHTRQVGSSGVVSVALTEYRINPESVHASPGVLTLSIHNYGRFTHNLVVTQNGQRIDGTTPLAPGQSAEISLSLASGTYLMASTILSDQALGQYGTLTVG